MHAPLVSVLMPVYNGRPFVSEAVESILCQTLRDFEFIVIDDGSTDGSLDVLRAFALRDTRIRLIESSHYGYVTLLNRGLSLCRGQYIARMDADDIACRDRLTRQIEYLKAHPSVGVVGGGMLVVSRDGRPIGISRPIADDSEVHRRLPHGNCLAHPTVVMRRDALLKVGGYRSEFLPAEDYDLWLRISEHCRLTNVPEIVLRYRVHDKQVSTTQVLQQVISTIAAQLAARSRATTGTDQHLSRGVPTVASLLRAGVSQQTLEQLFVSFCIIATSSLITAGCCRGAERLIQNVQRGQLGLDLSRDAIASIHFESGMTYCRVGAVIQGISHLARACSARPRVVTQLLNRLAARAVRLFH